MIRRRAARRPFRGFRILRLEDRITPAITTTWDPVYGVLRVSSDGADSITLSANSDRRVTVNGTAATYSSGLTIESRLVHSITVSGGPGNSVIDLSGVDLLSFSEMAEAPSARTFTPRAGKNFGTLTAMCVQIDGGAGNDTITGSQFDDLIDCFQGADQIDGGYGDDLFYIRNDDISGITINGGLGFNSIEVDYTKISLAKMQISLNFANSGKDSLSYGGKNIVMTGISATNVQDAIDELEFVLTYPAGPGGGGGGSVDLTATRGIAVDCRLPSPTQPTGGPGVFFTFDASKVGMSGMADNFAVRADSGSTPLAIDLTGSGNSLVVNTHDLGSTTTPTSVQVAGMAPITFSGMSAVSTEVRFYDAVALADLKALGVIISPSVTDNADGTQTFSLTVSNNSPITGLKTEWITSIGLPKITPKIAKESHGKFRVSAPGRIVGVTPGAGVDVAFTDTFSSLPVNHVAAGMEWSQEVAFTMPPLSPGQSSTNALSIRPRYHKPDILYPKVVSITCTLGGRNYDIDLSSYFETGDKPTQSQFAAVIDSATAKTPSGGATTLIVTDATGRTSLASSSASGIDSNITSMTAGAHLYAGQRMVDVAPDGTTSGNAPATVADMDLAGRYVVFESAATNLVAGLIDTNGATDVFVRDMLLGKTYCLSQNGGITGNGASFDPHMTSDGGCVVFRSSATNLVIGVSDANNAPDLFEVQAVFGLKTEWITATMTCVSLVPSTNQTCNKGVGWSDADGERESYTIAYLTDATNTGSPGTTGMQLGIKKGPNMKWGPPISTWTGTNTAGLTVSLDGSAVVVWTDADVSSLAGVPDTNGTRDILSIDASTGVVSPVSINHLGTAMADGPSPAYAGEVPAVSLDGSRIAFTSNSSTLIPGLLAPATDGVYLLELQGVDDACYRIDTVGAISWGSNNHDPSISADGTTIAWSSTTDYKSGGPAFTKIQSWVKDCYNGKEARKSSVLVSVTPSDGPSDGDSHRAIMARTGEYVLLSSDATNLVAGDTNGQTDVFASALHDTYRFQLSTTDPADVTLQYNSMTDSYQIVNTLNGGVVTELKASDGKKHFEVTAKWQSSSQRTITINMGSGLQRLGGHITVNGDTGNEKVALLSPPGEVVETDIIIGSDGTASVYMWRDLGDGGFVSDRKLLGTSALIIVRGAEQVATASVDSVEPDLLVIRSMNPVTTGVVSGGNVQFQSGSLKITASVTDLVQNETQILLILNPGDDTCTVDFTGLPVGASPHLEIIGNGGSDTITANYAVAGEAFVLDGSRSTDDGVIQGSAGHDTIFVGGSGIYTGGAGNDLYEFTQTYQVGVVVEDADGDTDRASFSSNGYGVTLNMDLQTVQTYSPGRQITVTGILEDATGGPFDDTFTAKALSVPRSFDGGSQVSSTGDTLIVDAEGKAATIFGGQVHVAGKAPISYTNFEHVSVINNAPTLQVAAIHINGGAVQRSRVTEIIVAFNRGATSFAGNGVSASNLVISNNIGGATVPFNVVSNEVEGFMVATITFPAGAPNYGSLPDGAFTLTVLASGLTTPLDELDGNGDGVIAPGGENYATPASLIFRNYGDNNANRTVDQNDFIAFRNSFGAGPSVVFDFDQDTAVAQPDFIEFRNNFNEVV